jgi:hypothetical protein
VINAQWLRNMYDGDIVYYLTRFTRWSTFYFNVSWKRTFIRKPSLNNDIRWWRRKRFPSFIDVLLRWRRPSRQLDITCKEKSINAKNQISLLLYIFDEEADLVVVEAVHVEKLCAL